MTDELLTAFERIDQLLSERDGLEATIRTMARTIGNLCDALAACKRLLQAVEAANGYDELLVAANHSGWADAYLNPACTEARAAIIKAEGASHA